MKKINIKYVAVGTTVSMCETETAYITVNNTVYDFTHIIIAVTTYNILKWKGNHFVDYHFATWML